MPLPLMSHVNKQAQLEMNSHVPADEIQLKNTILWQLFTCDKNIRAVNKTCGWRLNRLLSFIFIAYTNVCCWLMSVDLNSRKKYVVRRSTTAHDDVIKWKPYWPLVRGTHRSPMYSPHKGHWREALMCSLICAWTHGWASNRDTSDFRHHDAQFEVIVMQWNTRFIKRTT